MKLIKRQRNLPSKTVYINFITIEYWLLPQFLIIMRYGALQNSSAWLSSVGYGDTASKIECVANIVWATMANAAIQLNRSEAWRINMILVLWSRQNDKCKVDSLYVLSIMINFDHSALAHSIIYTCLWCKEEATYKPQWSIGAPYALVIKTLCNKGMLTDVRNGKLCRLIHHTL